MKIALFGATGFVGSHMLDALLAAGHQPRVLLRQGSERKLAQAGRCEVVAGDLDNAAAVAETVSGCEAVCYLVGLIREFPRRGITWQRLHWLGAKSVIDAARAAGAGRFLLMSANGVEQAATGYQRTKLQAEEYLRGSGLAWTIFRPSVIFGDPHGRMEFSTQLRDAMILPPLPAPLFYPGFFPRQAGQFPMAPVHVDNVAACFVRALELPDSVGRTYALCGPEALPWRELIDRISRAASGRGKWALPVPVAPLKALAGLLEGFAWFPVTRAQLDMLLDGNVCQQGDGALRELGVTPLPFRAEHLAYLRR